MTVLYTSSRSRYPEVSSLSLNAGRHQSIIFLSNWKYATPALLAVYNECPLQQNKILKPSENNLFFHAVTYKTYVSQVTAKI